jgi:hypothetical protein
MAPVIKTLQHIRPARSELVRSLVPNSVVFALDANFSNGVACGCADAPEEMSQTLQHSGR